MTQVFFHHRRSSGWKPILKTGCFRGPGSGFCFVFCVFVIRIFCFAASLLFVCVFSLIFPYGDQGVRNGSLGLDVCGVSGRFRLFPDIFRRKTGSSTTSSQKAHQQNRQKEKFSFSFKMSLRFVRIFPSHHACPCSIGGGRLPPLEEQGFRGLCRSRRCR